MNRMSRKNRREEEELARALTSQIIVASCNLRFDVDRFAESCLFIYIYIMFLFVKLYSVFDFILLLLLS